MNPEFAIVTFDFDTCLPSTLPPPKETDSEDQNFTWYQLSPVEFEQWVVDFLAQMTFEAPETGRTFSFYRPSQRKIVWVTVLRRSQVFTLSFVERNTERLPFEVELYRLRRRPTFGRVRLHKGREKDHSETFSG